jgi:hypothetical protein
MVEDPELKFDSRSAMDLKDRFRTYFNDSYRQLYPNAKTHLATLPKPTPKVDTNALVFDKSRSRKRRPFTAEEDAVLKAGYENHGPAWATIVSHPVFKAQNRRSTDLRDRFRNAFPDLYTQAGYKPRPPVPPRSRAVPKPPKRRKGSDGDLPAPTKLARGRRATTSALPDMRNAISDGELSADDELRVIAPTKQFTREPRRAETTQEAPASSPQPSTSDTPQPSSAEPELAPKLASEPPQPTADSTTSTGPDISSPPPSTPVESEQVSSQPSPIPSWPAQDFTSPPLALPTDYFPPTYRTLNMIPKSAWGPQDWLSSNPRMEASPHHPTLPHSASSGPPSFSPLNSSSYSHSQAVFDRYDLLSPGHLSSTYDFSQSEVGEHGGAHSAFSDADLFLGSSFRGFTHHSNTAGDLIFGTRSQGQGSSSNPHGSSSYDRFQTNGTNSVNPMQLHAIDERVESIRLNDQGAPQPSGLPSSSSLQSSLAASIPLSDLHGIPSLNIPSTEPNNQPFAITTDHQLFADHDAVITPTFSQPITQPPTTSTSPISSQAYPLSPRSMSLQSHNRLPFNSSFTQSQSSHSQDLMSQSINPDAWSMSDPFAFLHSNQLGGFGEDIPFLDLHYWGAPTSHPPNELGFSPFPIDHTTGALDLAQSSMQRNHPRTVNQANFPRTAQPPPTGTQVDFQQQKFQRPVPSHQRVQSAITTFDFQPPYSNDNKRKRVSWDGGH